ncbi:polysaccharide export outer membrane protein [Halospina denitrificans]|uniref:Polysaccharide export outer membrane protein n=1 Tax=Halospina denitrificans TaxID=332522 RepID=A0A4R7K0J2_9GAMM|nr:polysaccharide export protein [Halospina denitrificans]TDT43457.1 polysaccharide export outer membrane protein [Halospina denitrificans]
MKALIALILSISLAGCAYAPGSHISAGGWTSDYSSPPEEDYSDLVEVSRIGPADLRQAMTTQASPPAEELLLDDSDFEYRIGIGDVLQVIVWDHPELTIPAGSERSSQESGNVVNENGDIYYPYIGYVHVAGKTTQEVREVVADRLAHYLESPQVDVSVAAFRSQRIYVTGAVEKPGVYPLTNVPTRLVDAISQAGGLEENGDWRHVVLTRNGREYSLSLKDVYEEGNKQHNVLLKSGDVINVPQGADRKVFVLGEVGRTQTLPMGRNGLTLAEAISNVGGLDERRSDATGVFVARKADDAGPDSEHLIDLYQLNLNDATAMVMADSFHLENRDLVYVTAAPLARWNRVITQLVPSLSAVFLGERAANTVE